MTDTASPITGPHLTPMFATGAQPAMSPTTEPHHAPIFDTGPHPEPLSPVGADVGADSGPAADQPAAPAEPEPGVAVDAGIAADAEIAADAVDAGIGIEPPHGFSESGSSDTDPFLRAVTGHMPAVVAAQSAVVPPSGLHVVKRWKFALTVAGAWVLAAAAGLGFYFWWYTALTKTMPVFGILLFLVGCMVASILVSMVPDRPQLTALAIALMASPLASMTAAAVLHGAYYFEWIARPVIG